VLKGGYRACPTIFIELLHFCIPYHVCNSNQEEIFLSRCSALIPLHGMCGDDPSITLGLTFSFCELSLLLSRRYCRRLCHHHAASSGLL